MLSTGHVCLNVPSHFIKTNGIEMSNAGRLFREIRVEKGTSSLHLRLGEASFVYAPSLDAVSEVVNILLCQLAKVYAFNNILRRLISTDHE